MAITRVQHISERRWCRAIWARTSIWILTMISRSMRVGQKMPSKFISLITYVLSVEIILFYFIFEHFWKIYCVVPIAQKFPPCCHNPTTIQIIEKKNIYLRKNPKFYLKN